MAHIIWILPDIVHLIMRIDKFLWSARLFKTRSAATNACTDERIKLNDVFIKPAKTVAPGQIISIKVNPIWRSYKILDLPKSRVSAKLVDQFLVETTSPEDLLKLQHVIDINRENKKYGIKGRPTKKNRRDLDRLM
ncbi:MAG: RNA-binding S4 domain-containing protein [Flavobacteriales bacterium]